METIIVEGSALGDVITAFPALYSLAKDRMLRLHIANDQLRLLWHGPDVEMLADCPDVGERVNVKDIYKFFSQSGLHMIQGWFWKLGLAIPEAPTPVPLRFSGAPFQSVSVLLSPSSHSDEGTGLKQLGYEKWNTVIDALIARNISVAVGGLFASGKDERFWGDRPVVVLDSLSLQQLLCVMRDVRCTLTVDNGVGHLAYFLGVPHVHVIPRDARLSCRDWVSNRNDNASIIYEPFFELDAETLIGSVMTRLALPADCPPEHRNHISPVAKSRELFESFGDKFNRDIAPFMLEHRPDFHKDFMCAPWYAKCYAAWIKGNVENNAGDMARFYMLCTNLEQINLDRIPGDFVELGVHHGNSAAILAEFGRSAHRKIYLYDTFAGILGHWKLSTCTTLSHVKSLVGTDDVTYVDGDFPGSVGVAQLPDRIAFVHIDCDLYDAALAAIELFYPRMSPGGLLVIHDYGSGHWPGIRRAVDLFFSKRPEKPILIPDKSGSAIIRKLSLDLAIPSTGANAVLSLCTDGPVTMHGDERAVKKGAMSASLLIDTSRALSDAPFGQATQQEPCLLPYKVPFSVVVPTAYGHQIVLRYDDGLGVPLFRTGLSATHREILLMGKILQHASEGAVMVDVGANMGTLSLALSHAVGRSGKIHAFEPQRIIFNMLAGTMALNSVENVFCYQMALGSTAGRIEVPQFDYHKPMNFGGVEFGNDQHEPLSQARGHNPEKVEWVPRVTLDGFELFRLDLLKIDAEGMENEILDGAKETISRCRPVMFVEFLKVDADALHQRLTNMDYIVSDAGGFNFLALPREMENTLPGLDQFISTS